MKINFGEVIGFKLCCYYTFCRTLAFGTIIASVEVTVILIPCLCRYGGHQSVYGGDGTKADRDNHSNQLNPNNSR